MQTGTPRWGWACGCWCVHVMRVYVSISRGGAPTRGCSTDAGGLPPRLPRAAAAAARRHAAGRERGRCRHWRGGPSTPPSQRPACCAPRAAPRVPQRPAYMVKMTAHPKAPHHRHAVIADQTRHDARTDSGRDRHGSASTPRCGSTRRHATHALPAQRTRPVHRHARPWRRCRAPRHSAQRTHTNCDQPERGP